MRKKIIYLDGSFCELGEKDLVQLSPGIVSGAGVFETMRSDQGIVEFFCDHIKRIRRGISRLGLKLSLSNKEILDIIISLFEENNVYNSRIRLMVWRCSRQNKVAIICDKHTIPIKQIGKKSLSVKVSCITSRKSRYSHLKTLQYGHFKTAFDEACTGGFDEAILLNSKDEVVEGTRTNVFFVRKGVLMTPEISCGCLNGIARNKIIDIARLKGVPIQRVRVKVETMLDSEEIFLTNAVSGILPVKRINKTIVGDGGIRNVTSSIIEGYISNLSSIVKEITKNRSCD